MPQLRLLWKEATDLLYVFMVQKTFELFALVSKYLLLPSMSSSTCMEATSIY